MTETAVSKIPECRLLFVGKTSYDKRSVANSILRENVFDAHKFSDKIEVADVVTEVDGEKYKVEISDAPGIMELGNVRRAVSILRKNRIQLTNPTGYHAIVIVVRYPVRWTPEEKTFFRKLNKVLGKSQLKKYGILVFTNGIVFGKGDEAPSFDKYLENEMADKSKSSLGNIIRQIGKNKCMFINTEEENEEKNIEKLKELFSIITDIGGIYTTWVPGCI